MAAPVPYASRPYDNRQYAGSMADLIGRRGDINTQANYARGMANANMVGNLAGIAANTVSQYAGYKEQQRKEEVVRQEKERPRQIQAMVAGLPEEKREAALRELGEWDLADKQRDRLNDNVIRKLNTDHALRVDASDRSKEIAKRMRAIEQSQYPAYDYDQALPELRTLAGARANELPDVYDAKTWPMLRDAAMSYEQGYAQDAAKATAAKQAAEKLQAAKPGILQMVMPQLGTLGSKVDIAKWDGILTQNAQISDDPKINAQALAWLREVAPPPTEATWADDVHRASVLGKVEDTPKTPEGKELESFARDRGYQNSGQMQHKDWAAWNKEQADQKVDVARRSHVAPADPNAPKAQTYADRTSAYRAYTERQNQLGVRRDKALADIQAVSTSRMKPEERAAAIQATKTAYDTGMAANETWYQNAITQGPTTGGAAGTPTMDALVLPQGQSRPGMGPDVPSSSGTTPPPFFGGGAPPPSGAPAQTPIARQGGARYIQGETGTTFDFSRFTPEQIAAAAQALQQGARR